MKSFIDQVLAVKRLAATLWEAAGCIQTIGRCSLIVSWLQFASLNAHAGLVAYWNFDEASGATAHASVGGIDGALQNTAAFAPGMGIRGGAVRLDMTSNAFVTMGNNFAFGAGSFSVQAWEKTPPGDTNSYAAISKHYSGIHAGYFLAVNDVLDGAGGTSQAHFYDTGAFTAPSSIVVNDGNWHQLVGVYDAVAGKVFTYVDGQFQSSATGSPMVTNSIPLLVGGVGDASGTPIGFFTGLIDEVKLFDSALSASDVNSLYGTTVSRLAGDYNHNGIVDAADYTVWRDTLGQTGIALAADGNGNGMIDSGDYDVWKTNFGSHAGAGANAAVPEPATLWMLLAGILTMCSRRRAKVS